MQVKGIKQKNQLLNLTVNQLMTDYQENKMILRSKFKNRKDTLFTF